MKKAIITVIGIVLVLLVAFNFLMISLNFHAISPEGVSEIKVVNGLSGNEFSILDPGEIQQVTADIGNINPWLWFGSPGAGYVYYLRFFDAAGNELDSITIVSSDQIIANRSIIYANCSEILSSLENLEIRNTISQ